MLIYSRFLFMHTRSMWRHTFLGDTGEYTFVQTPSLSVHERGLGMRLLEPMIASDFGPLSKTG